MTGIIFNIKRFAVNDGPGIRTSIFLKGCRLRCTWCHNPESWQPYRQQVETLVVSDGHEFRETEMIGTVCSVSDIMEELEKERIIMEESGGGVTFTGGEPLYQSAFLQMLLTGSKERGFHTAVDTSGYATLTQLQKIVPVTDLFLYDLKFIDDGLHRHYTGCSNVPVLNNFKWLATQKTEIIVRVPLIRNVTATKDNIRKILDFILPCRRIVKSIDLLPHHRLGRHKYTKLNISYRHDQDYIAPDAEETFLIANLFEGEGFSVRYL